MNEENRTQNDPGLDQDALALIKRLQQQVSFLEKKIDLLLSLSQEKVFKGKPFYRHERGPREGSGDRDFGRDRDRHFKKHDGGENRGFKHKKKPFYFKRKHRDGEGR